MDVTEAAGEGERCLAVEVVLALLVCFLEVVAAVVGSSGD